MDETIDEYELKTTMSPKILKSKRDKNVRIKAPSILATKKNTRRSAIFGKHRPSMKPSKVVEIVSSTTDVSSSKTGSIKSSKCESQASCKVEVNEIIEISSDEEIIAATSSVNRFPAQTKTSPHKYSENAQIKKETDYVISGTDEEEDKNEKERQKIDAVRKTRDCNAFLSQTKIASIKNWINNITPQNNSVKSVENNDESGKKVGTDGKDQENAKKNTGSTRKVRKTPVNSTILMDTTFVPFDKWICKTHKAENSSKPVDNVAKLKEQVDLMENPQYHICDLAEKCKVLTDDISNLKISDKKEQNLKKTNTNQDIDDVKLKSPKINRIPEKSNEENNEVFITPAKQISTHDYAVKLLDDLYGTSWHKNRDKVFTDPKPSLKPQIQRLKTLKTDIKEAKNETEPKKPSNLPQNCLTEPRLGKNVKPSNFEVYRNPYLDSERAKSKNLLQSLEKERMLTKFKSPFFSNSSSSSEKREVNLPKLRTVLFPTSKENVETKGTRLKQFIKDSSSTDSSDIAGKFDNITLSDSESENDKVESIQRSDKLSFLASLSQNAPLDKCDASAIIFRKQFAQNREELCKKLFDMYNRQIFENCFPVDMQIKWNARLTHTAGSCVCIKKTHSDRSVSRLARLELSAKILDSADRLRDTLVHELCHAAAFIINEVSDGHGPVWKAWAVKARRAFPELPIIQRCHNYDINYKYTYKCTSCSNSFGRHSKSINLKTKACGICSGRFEVFINKTSKGKKKAVPCTPKKAATGFALFLKENYALHKSPSVSHAALMKHLSKKYQEQKETVNKNA